MSEVVNNSDGEAINTDPLADPLMSPERDIPDKPKPQPMRVRHQNGKAVVVKAADGTNLEYETLDITNEDQFSQSPETVVNAAQKMIEVIRGKLADFDHQMKGRDDLKPEAVQAAREKFQRELIDSYKPLMDEMDTVAARQAEHRQALFARAQYPERYSGNAMHAQRAATEIAMAMSMPLRSPLGVHEIDEALRFKNIDKASALIERGRTVKQATPGEVEKFEKVVQHYRDMLGLDNVEARLAGAEDTVQAVQQARAAIQTYGSINNPQSLIALGLAGLPKDTKGYLSAQNNPFKS